MAGSERFGRSRHGGNGAPARDSTDTAVLEHAAEQTRSVEAELDALDAAPLLPPRPTLRQVFYRSVLPPFVFLGLLVLSWQIAYSLDLEESYALPSPADVASQFGEIIRDGRAWTAIQTSVGRGILGFLAALALGTVICVVMWSNRWIRAGVGPIMSGCRACPRWPGCRPRSSGSACPTPRSTP